jgi:hypothetical protein
MIRVIYFYKRRFGFLVVLKAINFTVLNTYSKSKQFNF